MKRIRYILIILFLIIGIKNVYALDKNENVSKYEFDNTKKIYDYALILSSKEANKLKIEVDKYINNYNIDMAIITVKYYNQDTLDSYLSEFYKKNKFGLGNNKSAIFVVISLKNNIEDVYIKTFGDASELYSDNEIKNILKNMNNKENYSDKLDEFIKYSNNYLVNNDKTDNKKNILLNINWVFIFITSLIVSIVILSILLVLNKDSKEKKSNISFVKANTLQITTRIDKFITTNTKKKAINDRRK